MAQVEIEGGPRFDIDGNDTLLRGALRAGIGFPYECNVGGCGACKFELVAGEVQTLWPVAPGLTERDRKRGRRLACQSVPQGDVCVRVRTAPEYLPHQRPRRTSARYLGARTVTHDITEFSFHAEEPAQFVAGQYALLGLPGVEGERAYSMSNTANPEGLWQFMVRRVCAGAATSVLFDTLRVGEFVSLDGPFGMAGLRQPLERDMVCIAGGSGLAPMLSIARAAGPLLKSSQRRLHFYYGGRTAADLLTGQELEELQGLGDGLLLTQALSSPSDTSVAARQGFVHEVVETDLAGQLASCEIYFAGPAAMAQAVQDMLMSRQQVPYSQIHFDRFC